MYVRASHRSLTAGSWLPAHYAITEPSPRRACCRGSEPRKPRHRWAPTKRREAMTPLLWANFPLALIFFLAWSGIPLRMVIKHPDTQADFS